MLRTYPRSVSVLKKESSRLIQYVFLHHILENNWFRYDSIRSHYKWLTWVVCTYSVLFYVLHFFFYHLVPPSSSFFFLILLLLLFFFVVFIFCCCFVLLLMKGKTPGMRENRLPPAGEDVCAALHPTWSRGYQTCNPTLIRSSYYKTDEQGSNVKNIPGQSSATRHVEKRRRFRMWFARHWWFAQISSQRNYVYTLSMEENIHIDTTYGTVWSFYSSFWSNYWLGNG